MPKFMMFFKLWKKIIYKEKNWCNKFKTGKLITFRLVSKTLWIEKEKKRIPLLLSKSIVIERVRPINWFTFKTPSPPRNQGLEVVQNTIKVEKKSGRSGVLAFSFPSSIRVNRGLGEFPQSIIVSFIYLKL